MYEKVQDALIFALSVQKDQHSKLTDTPYVFHLLNVASLITKITADEDTITAGILHDAIEDAHVEPDEIKKRFGDRVFELVMSETEDKKANQSKSASWKQRKEESLEILKNSNDLGVKTLWLCDKLSNATSCYEYYKKHGEELWSHFNQKDPSLHKWYYYTVLENTKELSDTEVYKTYNDILEKLFGDCKA